MADRNKSKAIERVGDMSASSSGALSIAGLSRSDVVFQRFRLQVLGDGPEARVVFLCAEAGMGKTRLARDALEQLAQRGYFTRYESLAEITGSRARQRIQKIAREMCAATVDLNAPRALMLDDMPPIDECDLAKVRRAFERMIARNTFLIVCMRPEAELLAEEMGDCQCLLSPDLAGIYHMELEGQPLEAIQPTRDIAALMFIGDAPGMSELAKRSLWKNAVASLAAKLLRPTLPQEEQRLRLAMMLLGSGSFDELSSVLTRLDDEMLDWLSRDTPFFGVDRVQETFSCIGLSERDVFEGCLEQLRGACGQLPETVRASAQALANREDYARLASVFDLCDDRQACDIGCMWGVELLCEGKVHLVKKALKLHEELGLAPSAEYLLASQAMSYLDEPSARIDSIDLDALRTEETHNLARKCRIVELLDCSRKLDRGAPFGKIAIRRDDDDTARALVRHVKAKRLIFSGRFAEAYALLVNDPVRLSADTLVAALLCCDFEIAQMLTGELPHEEERRARERARLVLGQDSMKRLACYQSMIEPVAAVLMVRATAIEGAEEALARASRMGDDTIQAILLIVLAVLDNRRDAYARAHVRAVQAGNLLGSSCGRYLLLVSQLVDALAARGLGDSAGLTELAGRTAPSVVRDLSAYALCSSEEEASSVELTVLSRGSCSRDALWLLSMLSNDFNDQSMTFREVIPPLWLSATRRCLKRFQAGFRRTELVSEGEGEAEAVLAEAGEQASSPGPDDPGVPVYISLLGGFTVTVNGNMLSGVGMANRRAGTVLSFLAMRRGHTMRRYELIECVWPECDFDSGRQKVYEACSAIRAVIKRANGGEKLDPFIVSKIDGSICLDPNLVACDVDQFEHLAHAALAETSDPKVVDLAMKAADLYRGDVCETCYDATGAADLRRTELRNLFVDVSVAGASAAMREDLLPLAVRMAWAAHGASDMREDVVLVLVEALRMSGRVIDARNVYLSYARRLLEQTGEPPSASLRTAMARLFPSSRNGSSKRAASKRAAYVYA